MISHNGDDQSHPLTEEDYARAERLLPWNAERLVHNKVSDLQWIEEGARFWYRLSTSCGKEFVVVDPATEDRRPAFDHARLASHLSTAAATPYVHTNLPFNRFEYVKGRTAIRFSADDTVWETGLDDYRCRKIRQLPAEPGVESPDGKREAFVRDHNLYVRSLDTGAEAKMTGDGETDYSYATPPRSRLTAITEQLQGTKPRSRVIWSPDSGRLLTYRLDERRVQPMHLIQSVVPGQFRPVLHSYPYPLPGDEEIPLAQIMAVDVDSGRLVSLDVEPLGASVQCPVTAGSVWWGDDGFTIYILSYGRGFKSMTLHAADSRTGESRVVVREDSPARLAPCLSNRYPPALKVLPGGEEVIWFSERDGWGHLYLYDAQSGEIRNQITSGPWAVHEIPHVDAKGRYVYFTAGGREQGRDPYLRHLYRAQLDGSEPELLTCEEADHQISFSPAGDCFVDTYSRIDAPPVSILRAADGSRICNLEHADVRSLRETGWQPPLPFTVKARDGVTDLYGLMFRPSNFDSERKYPVIDSIYPGPQRIRTPKEFTVDEAYALAELGFVVVTIDGMGTPLRSRAFIDVAYGENFGEAGGLTDHVAGLKQLGARHDYLDLSRVGIYGHSGGGYASTRALLLYPDFYKVAVSSAGNHDQRGYSSRWGEHYIGLPQNDIYAGQSNLSLAGNLAGKLFLIHGDMDDNVHPALSLMMVNALMEANKDFDFLMVPNRNHAMRDVSKKQIVAERREDPYVIRRRWDYFVRHLLGSEPPVGYVVREPVH